MEVLKSLPQSLLDKTKGIITVEDIQKLKQKENAALAMCGGLLGNCYLLAEVAESLMVDALYKFKKEKWYKHNIKQSFKSSMTSLHTTIATSIRNSPTNADYMREVADAILNELTPDLFKLKNAILLELDKRKILYSKSLADMLTIDILLRYIRIEYDDVIEYMQTIFKTFYDSWYHPAKCENAYFWWNNGVQSFAKQYIPEDLDLNNISNIQNGIAIIQKKMHSSEIADAVKKEASKWADAGEGQTLYEKSLKILEELE